MNLMHILLAFGAGVIFTIIGYVVANVVKPKEVDRVDGDIRAGADKARDIARKARR
jgi:hypothetical protein